MKLLLASLVWVVVFFFPVGEVVSAQETERFSLPEIFEYPATKDRDPFSPLIIEKKVEIKPEPKPLPKPEKKKPLPVITDSEYKLVGIVWYGKEGIALISKRERTWVVKEGMVFDGFKVARIEGKEGEVTLIGEDKIIQLKMLEI